MMHRRTRITIAVVAIVLFLLAGALYLRKEAPPESARLLPESDGIVYVDLKPLRAVSHFDQQPVTRSPEYQRFIDATGIEFERDLDNAAFALHRMANPLGPNGAVAFSEVFQGHFDGRRLARYLDGVASSRETYAGHAIYSIPSDGRTDRVTILGYDMIAVSNTPSAEQIHSMVDRYRTAALPFSGSSLLAEHYRDVPLLALAWGIGQIGLPLGDGGGAIKILGMRLPLTVDATFIASLRWTGAFRLKVEEIAPTQTAASLSADSVRNILDFVKNAENSMPGRQTDADLRTLLNSAAIEQHNNRAVLTATIPAALLERMAGTRMKVNGTAQ